MLEIENRDLFGKVIAQAVAQVTTKAANADVRKRWVNAIAKAVANIEENAYMHWDESGEFMLIKSEVSNEIYEANGKCQCKAYDQQVPCWHRAAARIWKNYLKELNGEQIAVQPARISSEPIYLKSVVKGGVKINGCLI